jgi:two-component system phosphate regulon sensor histidine kinase PhoR
LNAAEVDAICKEIGKQSATRITVILPSGQVIGDSRETPHQMNNHADRPEIAMALAGNPSQFGAAALCAQINFQ